MSRVVRLVPDVEAAEVVWCCTGVVDGPGLNDSSTNGEGETVERGSGESEGAGMTVTTADGDDGRDRLGDGEAGLGLGLGLAAADREGVGSGGMTPVGELDGSARGELLGEGFGAALALALGLALGVGEGAGAAEAVDPSRTAGVSAVAARASSSDRRTFGTR